MKKKSKAIPLPKMLEKAQKVVNEFIRLRDQDQPCISCGKEGNQAGHYIPVNKSSYLRFDERNINLQLM
jgi:hypothetical protein